MGIFLDTCQEHFARRGIFAARRLVGWGGGGCLAGSSGGGGGMGGSSGARVLQATTIYAV